MLLCLLLYILPLCRKVSKRLSTFFEQMLRKKIGCQTCGCEPISVGKLLIWKSSISNSGWRTVNTITKSTTNTNMSTYALLLENLRAWNSWKCFHFGRDEINLSSRETVWHNINGIWFILLFHSLLLSVIKIILYPMNEFAGWKVLNAQSMNKKSIWKAQHFIILFIIKWTSNNIYWPFK